MKMNTVTPCRLGAFAIMVMAACCVPGPARADVNCRIVCTKGAGACLKSPGDLKPDEGGNHSIAKCDSADLSVQRDARVWYPRNGGLATKFLAKGSAVAPAVKDGDAQCSFLRCLTTVRSGSVAGANPMGEAARAQASDPAAIAAGLPFGELHVPAEGLPIRIEAAPPAGTGRFTLSDAAGRPLAVLAANEARMVLIPAAQLQPTGAYRYRWEAPGQDLQGSFKVARGGTVRRAQAAAELGAGADPSPENRRLALAAAYLEAGLSWNARDLLGAIERGE